MSRERKEETAMTTENQAGAEPSTPLCPNCNEPLKKVRIPNNSMLNSDQFDAVRAGDYFCECHNNGRSHTPYAYFWERELTQPAAERLAEKLGFRLDTDHNRLSFSEKFWCDDYLKQDKIHSHREYAAQALWRECLSLMERVRELREIKPFANPENSFENGYNLAIQHMRERLEQKEGR